MLEDEENFGDTSIADPEQLLTIYRHYNKK